MIAESEFASVASASIEIIDVCHHFGEKEVLKNITISIARNKFLALLGPSGCGKTTLLRCIAGLLRPKDGRILLDGRTPTDVRMEGRLSFNFQSPTLLPWRTLLANVLLPIELIGDGKFSEAQENLARQLLRDVGLGEEILKYPHMLSGGMQQRVGLARSLVTRPSYLFLDEPFSALDGVNRDKLNERLRYLWQRTPFTCVFVTHTAEEAVFLADQVAILSDRPANILDIVDINLGTSRDLSTRTRADYDGYVKTIRAATRKP